MTTAAGFLTNAWYPASWSENLETEPVARTFLGQEIVLYRQSDGAPVALGNVCPHRFAALAKGKLHGDDIACPYHGLRFGPDGQCSHNPHGPTPRSVRVRAYPLAEKYGMIWIWMGSPEKAAPALLPDIPAFEESEFDWVRGGLHVEGNYQLVIDNLLDLTHVEFMHPYLAAVDSDGGAGESGRAQVTCHEQDEYVISEYRAGDTPRTPLVAGLWEEAPATIGMTAIMRWSAPANLVQQNIFVPGEGSNSDSKGPLLVPFCHLLTPETRSTTHYFWASGRNMKVGIPEVSAALSQGVTATFNGEDEPMIADLQLRIGDRDLMDMRPLLLPIDKSAVLARRKLAKLIDHEQHVAA